VSQSAATSPNPADKKDVSKQREEARLENKTVQNAREIEHERRAFIWECVQQSSIMQDFDSSERVSPPPRVHLGVSITPRHTVAKVAQGNWVAPAYARLWVQDRETHLKEILSGIRESLDQTLRNGLTKHTAWRAQIASPSSMSRLILFIFFSFHFHFHTAKALFSGQLEEGSLEFPTSCVETLRSILGKKCCPLHMHASLPACLPACLPLAHCTALLAGDTVGSPTWVYIVARVFLGAVKQDKGKGKSIDAVMKAVVLPATLPTDVTPPPSTTPFVFFVHAFACS